MHRKTGARTRPARRGGVRGTPRSTRLRVVEARSARGRLLPARTGAAGAERGLSARHGGGGWRRGLGEAPASFWVGAVRGSWSSEIGRCLGSGFCERVLMLSPRSSHKIVRGGPRERPIVMVHQRGYSAD